MKLILTADVPNLGEPGDLVEVKDGYGRNYLLPRKLAIAATRGAEKQVAQISRSQQTRKIRDLDHANEVAGQLSALPAIPLAARAAAGSGRLFGSVTSSDVADAVRTAGGPALDKRAIELPGQVKTVGSYQMKVRLHPDVTAEFTVEVTAS